MRVSCTDCGVTLESSYLKQKMASLHGICVPQMRGVDEEGGGNDHQCGVLPQNTAVGEVPGAGMPGGRT